MNAVLIVALHFPPFTTGSGYQRTLAFTRGLPARGWRPLVLTATQSAFRARQMRGGEAPPEQVEVIRAFALDTQRHLALAGRYPGVLALPDRWVSWWLAAVVQGLAAVRRHRPAAIFSTYPIATAHLIALTLARLTRLPWIADFRDPMIDDDYPEVPAERTVRGWIERRTIARCARAVFTTPGACAMYRARYPSAPEERLVEIPNGFDEASFLSAGADAAREPRRGGPFTILHSGVLYRDVRSPRHLFQAMARLVARGAIGRSELRVVLRAAATEDFVRGLAREASVEDMIELAPGVPYVEALREMLSVDALLLMQGSGSNRQVPAKAYEYLRAGRPILALVDPAGDSAKVLADAGTGLVAALDDTDAIEARLGELVHALRSGTASGCPAATAARYSRSAGVDTLASLLDQVAGGTST